MTQQQAKQKSYSILELQKMEEFRLFELASFYHIAEYNKMHKQPLLYAILDAQHNFNK